MTFVTLRDLNTDDTVLGQDWQDLRSNFEYLKSPPEQFRIQNGPYIVSGPSWQWTDPTNLMFELTTLGGPLVLYFGCHLDFVGGDSTVWLAARIGDDRTSVIGRFRQRTASEIATIGVAVPVFNYEGTFDIGLQHYVVHGTCRIVDPYIAAREF